MRQFNTPPDWPDPPTARWRPPKRWRPAESWPPAPAGWSFWVNENGKPVRGPIGRYGGPGIVKVGAVVALPLALIALVLFNPLGSRHDSATTAPTTRTETTPARPSTVPTAETSTPGQTETPTGESSQTPSSTPTPAPPTLTPASTPTPTVSQTPSPTTTVQPTPTTAPITGTTVVYKSCAEVRAAGKAPLHRGDPGYSTDLDHNGDGVACERGNS